MSALRKPIFMVSAEEYLRRERLAEARSEYVNGEIVPVGDENMEHAEICGNILSGLHLKLRGHPGHVFTCSFKVRIERANVFRYPDVSGRYGPVLFHDMEREAYCNPAVIVEVLSPSTQVYDRGEKFMLYRLLDSLFEYVLVSQDRVEVEVWTRGSEGVWSSVVYNEVADSFSLRTLNCTLTLAEIYERVEFAAGRRRAGMLKQCANLPQMRSEGPKLPPGQPISRRNSSIVRKSWQRLRGGLSWLRGGLSRLFWGLSRLREGLSRLFGVRSRLRGGLSWPPGRNYRRRFFPRLRLRFSRRWAWAARLSSRSVVYK